MSLGARERTPSGRPSWNQSQIPRRPSRPPLAGPWGNGAAMLPSPWIESERTNRQNQLPQHCLHCRWQITTVDLITGFRPIPARTFDFNTHVESSTPPQRGRYTIAPADVKGRRRESNPQRTHHHKVPLYQLSYAGKRSPGFEPEVPSPKHGVLPLHHKRIRQGDWASNPAGRGLEPQLLRRRLAL